MAGALTTRLVTQADIARQAGCSQNAVTMALRGTGRLSPSRRQQILEIAQGLGYRPNIAARSLVQRRSGFIGVFTGNPDSVRTQIISQLLVQLHCTDYRPILGLDVSLPNPWHTAPWVQTLLDLRVEALVALAWMEDLAPPAWLAGASAPKGGCGGSGGSGPPVVIAAIQPNPQLPCDVVALDRAAAGRAATQYLLSRGHRRIAVVVNQPRRALLRGCTEALRDVGLAPVPLPLGPHDGLGWQDHLHAMVEHLAQRPPGERPTAALVLNSVFAVELIDALAQRGLRVPEDLALIGYDMLPLAERLRVPLTTIEQPVAELARQVIDLTRRRLESPQAPPVHQTLEHTLALRRSA